MPPALSPLAARVETLLGQPTYFWQVIEALSDQTYRTILRVWAEVRENRELDRDELGRYWLK
jgi:hypothetical protein